MFKRFVVIGFAVFLAGNASLLSSRLGGISGLFASREAADSAAYFRSVIELIHEHYVEELQPGYDQLTEAALEGMLRSLDPHSEFMPARKFENLRAEMKSEFGGIGVQIEMRDDKVVVIAPIADTPGERAGIMRGDQIVAVDGKLLGKMSLDKVVERLRGTPGSAVEVTLFRPGSGDTYDVRIVRQVIKINNIRDAGMLDDGIGYLALTQFSERTGQDFAAALDRLEAEGMRALIIDLRNNPGGLLSAAVDVAEQFFSRGELIVYTQGRHSKSRENIYARRSARSRSYPMAVLINSGSASAAEIVAGALKDTGRAVIIGETSFGKGSVQSILPLRNGQALRLTTAKYYTPAGVIIHERGVEPHVAVTIPLEEEGRLRLQRMRSDLREDPEAFQERFGFRPVEDRQLRAAIDALRGVEIYARGLQPAEPAELTASSR